MRLKSDCLHGECGSQNTKMMCCKCKAEKNSLNGWLFYALLQSVSYFKDFACNYKWVGIPVGVLSAKSFDIGGN